MKYYIYEALVEDKKRYFLTLLDPAIIRKKGLKKQVILGEVTRGDNVNCQEFVPNAAFLELFHKIVSREILKESDLKAAAKKKGSGWLYIVDGRVKDRQEKSDQKDIIGSCRVSNGKILEGSYNANPNYCIISEDGFFKLPHRIRLALINELRRQLK